MGRKEPCFDYSLRCSLCALPLANVEVDYLIRSLNNFSALQLETILSLFVPLHSSKQYWDDLYKCVFLSVWVGGVMWGHERVRVCIDTHVQNVHYNISTLQAFRWNPPLVVIQQKLPILHSYLVHIYSFPANVVYWFGYLFTAHFPNNKCIWYHKPKFLNCSRPVLVPV